MAYFASTRHEPGTSRGAVALVLATRLLDGRGAELAAFPTFSARDTSKEDVERALGKQAKAIARLRLVVPTELSAFRHTEAKWAAFRKAEIALYGHAFGAAQGVAKVGAAVAVLLAERRATDAVP
jgi:hypothetical protein